MQALESVLGSYPIGIRIMVLVFSAPILIIARELADGYSGCPPFGIPFGRSAFSVYR
jgi:hypothetical protein